ncbi:hypothetical protein JCM9279_005142 [Rhodotorula babjevae]
MAPTLPVELILETILLSLDKAPTTPRTLTSSPSPTASGSTPPCIDEADPLAATCPLAAPPSREALLRSYTLTSRTFRSLAQPLLFRHPVLLTPTSLRAFLAAVENREEDARLGGSVHSVVVGPASEEHGGAHLVANLKSLKLDGAGLAPARDRRLAVALPVTDLALVNCRVSPSSLRAAHFPTLKSLRLVVPGATRAAPDGLVDFLRGVAPHLRSLSLHDQAAHEPALSEALIDPDMLDSIYDAFPSMSSLIHLDIVNALPTHALSLLPLATLSSLRTISLTLSGLLASGASRRKIRWAPLADSLLHDALAALRILLLPPEALFPYKGALADDPAALPGWVRALQRSEALERVVLPARAFEDRLGEMVRELEGALERWGRRVVLVAGTAEAASNGEGCAAGGRVREERAASSAEERSS